MGGPGRAGKARASSPGRSLRSGESPVPGDAGGRGGAGSPRRARLRTARPRDPAPPGAAAHARRYLDEAAVGLATAAVVAVGTAAVAVPSSARWWPVRRLMAVRGIRRQVSGGTGAWEWAGGGRWAGRGCGPGRGLPPWPAARGLARPRRPAVLLSPTHLLGGAGRRFFSQTHVSRTRACGGGAWASLHLGGGAVGVRVEPSPPREPGRGVAGTPASALGGAAGSQGVARTLLRKLAGAFPRHEPPSGDPESQPPKDQPQDR